MRHANRARGTRVTLAPAFKPQGQRGVEPVVALLVELLQVDVRMRVHRILQSREAVPDSALAKHSDTIRARWTRRRPAHPVTGRMLEAHTPELVVAFTVEQQPHSGAWLMAQLLRIPLNKT